MAGWRGPGAWSDAVKINVSEADTSNPPSDAELDAAFGTPADVGAGFSVLLNDAGGSSNVYLVMSDGTKWWYVALTAAA